jgi:hypothetical protein
MARKKIEPVFEEPIKNIVKAKKVSVVKSSTIKKEVLIVKPKVNKKVELVKPIPKVKKSSSPIVTPSKKEIEVKTPVKRERKIPVPKIRETEIKEPEEEQIEIQEEKKPAYIKEPKRKPKVDKNAPQVNKKHTLKVGTRVVVTFLGQPEPGIIIELTEEGMYKIKSDRGVILPRAKYEGGEIIDKRYPSYIIAVIK